MTDSKAKKEKRTSLSMPQSVAFGSIFGVIVTVLLLIVFALVLALSEISDSTILAFAYIATVVGAFAGAFMASSRIRKNGLLTGFFNAAVYLTLMFFVKVIFSGLGGISVWTLAYLGAAIVASLAGGVAGVNKKNKR